MVPVIVTEGVTRVYSGDGVPVHALRGIDLTIERGEFAALVGPSGSGKTTFLNIISGLDTPTDGTGLAQWQTFVAHGR